MYRWIILDLSLLAVINSQPVLQPVRFNQSMLACQLMGIGQALYRQLWCWDFYGCIYICDLSASFCMVLPTDVGVLMKVYQFSLVIQQSPFWPIIDVFNNHLQ